MAESNEPRIKSKSSFTKCVRKDAILFARASIQSQGEHTGRLCTVKGKESVVFALGQGRGRFSVDLQGAG